MPSTDSPSPQDELDIQGNIVGFNKDHARLIYVAFPDQASGRRFLAAMIGEVNNAHEVKAFNHQFKQRQLAGEDELTEQVSWVNLALSFAGLSQIEAEGIANFPQDFMQGMAARAGIIGDVEGSDPSNWVGAFTPSAPPVHAVVILAADSADLLDARTTAVRAIIAAQGVTGEAPSQDGQTRPDPEAGHEHFGFRDGISQPSIRGLTVSSKGGDEIAAGEFLIGYTDEDGNLSGSGVGQPDQPPTPGQPGYPAPQPIPAQPLPAWTRNGSFLVLRRLRQDVNGFHSFLGGQAGSAGLNADQLGAKMVGRWPSGAPLEHVAPEAHSVDPTAEDPSIAEPRVLLDEHINNFDYQEHDADGHLMPLAAHIRKAYPRDEDPPGEDESSRHRILRRGIPYGPEVQPGEPPYGGDPVPDDRDRGLLFLCYQASIARGFEFIQQTWVNAPDFPTSAAGQDPIISQNVTNPPFPLPGNPHLVTNRWVTTTGGGYFFSPGISALRLLATPPS